MSLLGSGAAVDVGADLTFAAEVHTNAKKFQSAKDVLREFHNLVSLPRGMPGHALDFNSKTLALNVQGPGVSSDYLFDEDFLPRADFRCVFLLFFNSILPQRSAWELEDANIWPDGMCSATREWFDSAVADPSILTSPLQRWFWLLFLPMITISALAWVSLSLTPPKSGLNRILARFYCCG